MSFSGIHIGGATLVALHADLRPAEWNITSDVCIIGRLPTCQIVVNRASVSRKHALIERRGTFFVLNNLSATNGTYVNGQLITAPYELRHQDLIGLANGTPLLRFLDHEVTTLEPRTLAFDQRTHRYLYQGVPLDLPRNAIRLLDLLYGRVGEVCSHEDCIRAVWADKHFDSERMAQLHKEISELRDKFKAIDPQAQVIRTRHKIGYYLDLSR